MRAILIPVRGPMRVVEVTGWESMAAAIGSKYIERVAILDETLTRYLGRVIVVDEEGLLTDQPVNLRASYLYGIAMHGSAIRGNVLFVAEAWVEDGLDFVDFDPAADLLHLNERFGEDT